MLDPQFLAQIRSYLNANGNRALDAGIGSLTGSAPAPKPDALSSGIQSGISSVMGHTDAKKASSQEFMPVPIQMNTPPSTYVPGRSGEFNYGIGNPQSATAIRAYNPDYYANSGIGSLPSGGSSSQSQPAAARSDRERSDRSTPAYVAKGPAGRAQENGMAPASKGLFGGIGSILRDAVDGGGLGKSGDKFVGGLGSMLANAAGVKPYKKAEGGPIDALLPSQGMNEKDLISQAISAIKGESPDPRPVLAAFVSKYGEDALRNLVDKVEGGDVDATAEQSQGQLRGPGDGMSDMIPASVDGQGDVLLSDGEYVVPADVVSGLGNGSSDAGAKHLDEMMARVREQRTGSREQAKQIEPKQAMPA
jgi:hypothetical protein